MRRVVVDTNVLVSAAIAPTGSPALVLAAWERGEFELLVSQTTVDELASVFARPKLAAKYSLDLSEIAEYIAELRSHVVVLVPGTDVRGAVPQHPRDDHVLAAAVSSEADCIVTGDQHLLALGSYRDIPILTPAEFLRRLEG